MSISFNEAQSNKLQHVDTNNRNIATKSSQVESKPNTTGYTSPLMGKDMLYAYFKRLTTGLEIWMSEFIKNMPKLPLDPTSNAEPHKAVTTHLVWDVEAPNFDMRQLRATATYTYNNLDQNNDRLVLDIRNIEIDATDPFAVTVNGKPAKFEIINSNHHDLPDALRITIPQKKGGGAVSIKYQTKSDATGIFWIEKQYTEGQKHPLLYTLFQPTSGASVIPGQHTPQVRLTYEVNAKTANPDLMVLSSVNNNPTARNNTGDYQGLRMNRAVPLYLLSLHVGNFVHKGYSDKVTGVYAEEAMIDDAAEKLKMLPEFMKAAEEVCGPYNWGKYCPIILCWAFPYMAMEHPCASTCGAVCLEQPNVIIHELAHSWSGNDTTNCNWQQFFWNEGFTTFIEYLITEKIYGEDHASMIFLYTLAEAKEAMDKYRSINTEFLKLCNNSIEQEFTRIPYAKGALFFFMLRDAIGHDNFSKFIKDYMKVFYQNTMSDSRFLAFLKVWLEKRLKISDFDGFKKQHQIDEWLYGVEIPSNATSFKSNLLNAIDVQITKIHKNEPFDKEIIQTWGIDAQLLLLSRLKDKVNNQQLANFDSQMKYTNSSSMSIRGGWAHLCAVTKYFTPATSNLIVSYIIKRNSLHEANKISSALCKSTEGRKIVERILSEENGRLFPITKEKLKKNLETIHPT